MVVVVGAETWASAAGEGVDEGEDFIAAGDGEAAAGHEIGLEVDEEEGGGGLVDGHRIISRSPSFRCAAAGLHGRRLYPL